MNTHYPVLARPKCDRRQAKARADLGGNNNGQVMHSASSRKEVAVVCNKVSGCGNEERRVGRRLRLVFVRIGAKSKRASKHLVYSRVT